MHKETIKPAKGRIWVGRYRGRDGVAGTGDLGWLMPPYLAGSVSLSVDQQKAITGHPAFCRGVDFYRVEVTLTPARNKKGAYIVKKYRGPRG